MIRLSILALLAACASSPPAPAPAPAPAPEPEHHEEMNMPPTLAAFHDVLAPRWHAAKGPERMHDTCGAIDELARDADAAAHAQPPAGADARAWTVETTRLVGAVSELGDTCKANDAAKFEDAF